MPKIYAATSSSIVILRYFSTTILYLIPMSYSICDEFQLREMPKKVVLHLLSNDTKSISSSIANGLKCIC